MIKRLFSSIKTHIKSFFSFCGKLSVFFKKQTSSFKQAFGDLYYHLNNMATSNMNLGIYHLYNRNYSDAIFRFQMVDRFLDPNNKKADYWLGLAYLLKGNHKKSIIHLIKAEKEDKIKLLDFVKSIDTAKTVPEEIYQINRDVMSALFIDRFISKEENLPKKLVLELNHNISKLPKEYSILELGSNMGVLGYELNKRMQDKMHLTAVESSEVMIKLESEIFVKAKIYDKIINNSVRGFLKSNKKKYDIICSVNGFAFDADLTKIFTSISSQLKPSGYFAFAVKSSADGVLLNQDLEFSYDNKALVDQLSKAGFQILASKKISLEIKNNYSIFVCVKSK